MHKDKGNLVHLDTNMNNKKFVFKSKGESENGFVCLYQLWEFELGKTKIIRIWARLQKRCDNLELILKKLYSNLKSIKGQRVPLT